jgi:hypothetical protein
MRKRYCPFLNPPIHAFDFEQERYPALNKMKVTRIYTGDDNRSHFEDIEIDIAPSKSGLISEIIPATGVIFRETSGDYDYDFHTAPRRQYIINLDAAVEITVGSGEKRILEQGEVFLAEDTTGQGHISRAVDGKIRHSMFITLD